MRIWPDSPQITKAEDFIFVLLHVRQNLTRILISMQSELIFLPLLPSLLCFAESVCPPCPSLWKKSDVGLRSEVGESSWPSLNEKNFSSELATRNGDRFILRSPRPDDVRALLDYVNSLVDERKDDPDIGIVIDKKKTEEEEKEWLSELLGKIREGRAVAIIAESQGRIVGMLGIRSGVSKDESHHGKLYITVAKNYRNLGIGTAMMSKALELSKDIGIRTLELEVFANNLRAIHLYEKTGFTQVGRIPKKIQRDGKFIDIIMMWKEL
jgi:RimJ/RimL family protein N-acetyltransferase